MHAPGRRRWRSWREVARRHDSATVPRSREVLVARGRAAGVRLAERRAHRGRRRRGQRATRRRSPPDFSASAVPGAAPRRYRHRARSLSAMTWALRREDRRVPAAPPQRVLLRPTMPPSSTTSSHAARCPDDRRSMSARRTATTSDTGRSGPERLLLPRQRAANRRHRHSYDAAEIEQCAERTFGVLERCGLQHPATDGCDAGDDACGFRTGCSRRRAARCTAAASHGWTASFQRPGARTQDPGALSGGGQHASGAGRADGGAVGPDRRRRACSRTWLRPKSFRAGGYAWWYVDALSDDGQHGMTMIAFIGSVFSPYYAFARRSGAGRSARPLRHQRRALRPGRQPLGDDRAAARRRPAARPDAFADRAEPTCVGRRRARHARRRDHGADALARSAAPSASFPTGRSRSRSSRWTKAAIIAGGRWRPARGSRSTLERPRLRWRATGYFDMNRGDEPLEGGFADWQWCARRNCSDGAAILYEAQRRDGSRVDLAMSLRSERAACRGSSRRPSALKRTGLARAARDPQRGRRGRVF